MSQLALRLRNGNNSLLTAFFYPREKWKDGETRNPQYCLSLSTSCRRRKRRVHVREIGILSCPSVTTNTNLSKPRGSVREKQSKGLSQHCVASTEVMCCVVPPLSLSCPLSSSFSFFCNFCTFTLYTLPIRYNSQVVRGSFFYLHKRHILTSYPE